MKPYVASNTLYPTWKRPFQFYYGNKSKCLLVNSFPKSLFSKHANPAPYNGETSGISDWQLEGTRIRSLVLALRFFHGFS